MDLQLFAGIDAGGTSTRCVVADRTGTLLGRGQAGPGNATLAGEQVALSSITASLAAALGGLPAARVVHLHVAAAGTVVPAAIQHLAAAWSSSNDAPAAFAGALVQGPGLIVIAGTGSACYGQDARGREALIGGWGPLAGDEGSAYAIGCAGLQRLAWALDGRIRHTHLTRALLQHLGADDRDSFLARIYNPLLPREAVAALASLVTLAAQQGDRQAAGLLARAGDALGQTAAALARILKLEGAAARVVTLGGVFAAGPLVLVAFGRRLQHLVPDAQMLPARFPPVIGALLLGYRAAGIEVDGPLLARLAAGPH